MQQSKFTGRSNSISGTGAKRSNTQNIVAAGVGNGYASNDDSLFAQFGNDEEFRPAVQEISEA